MARVKDRSFLGSGLSFPFAITQKLGGVSGQGASSLSDATERVRQALLTLFNTGPPERVIRRNYGAGLSDLVFEPIDPAISDEIVFRVTQAVRRHEFRVSLDDVTVNTQHRAHGLLQINVSFTVLDTNQPGNLVFPFYLQAPGEGPPGVLNSGFVGA